ncbi:MAG: peptidylprolyl isomerase, partial [Dehalococcoidales bacterium]|nr:peptidylprolyl isomerase [Dehalococcoidales bacterium]
MKTVKLSRIITSILVGSVMLVASCAGTASDAPSTPPNEPVTPPKRKSYSAPPPMKIDTNKQYTAKIETSKGRLVLELYTDVPVTVNNFVFLAREGFYDNTTFHRIIPDFMAQGGDPTGTGRGGPGYSFAEEFTRDASGVLEHKHGTGSLSMANAGPNTNG